MSQDSYALRQLKQFILNRVKQHAKWKPVEGMSDAMIDDCLFAIKMRKDESHEILYEINRVLKFKPSGRKKQNKEGEGDE